MRIATRIRMAASPDQHFLIAVRSARTSGARDRIGLAQGNSFTRVRLQIRQSVSAGARRCRTSRAKRAVDLVGAALSLLGTLPVILLCALAVRLTSRGPILYRQRRVGQSGCIFTCWKFRTMYVGAERLQEGLRQFSVQDGPAFKILADPRVTPVGRVLRKFSLDELPQLANVLAGNMSLVGPRPPLPSEVVRYEAWQLRRLAVRPGLTCIWQVWGRNRVGWQRWVEMDLQYIDNWSLWLDFKLLVHTVPAVWRGSGC